MQPVKLGINPQILEMIAENGFEYLPENGKTLKNSITKQHNILHNLKDLSLIFQP